MTTRFTDHLLTGDHASRPAFGDVPQGTLYACSDHDLIYQSDGSTAWSTWSDVSGSAGGVATDAIWDAAGDLAQGTGANTAAKLSIGAAGSFLQVNSGATAAAWFAMARTTNQLGAPVTMTNANTYYDGPSLSLNGTFLVMGTVSMTGNDSSVTHTAKLWNGTTVASSATTLTYGGAAGRKYSCITLMAFVTTSGAETWKISVAGDGAGGSILATATVNGAGATASTLVALKLA